ncbi:SufD family Fe-S cluster assembly protein [bacterium]|nr:SufD family Fe-S cluster assembly protein [bacterium]
MSDKKIKIYPKPEQVRFRVDKFDRETKEHSYQKDLSKVSVADRKNLIETGVDVSEKGRSGTFIQADHSVIHAKSLQKGLEVMNISDALKKYDWLKKYWWNAVSKDGDEYTALSEKDSRNGYFIRALRGVKVLHPIQSCLFLKKENLLQNVHNLIIAEEGSELNIITGCTTASYVKKGAHVGISEFYIKKNATVKFTMIHNWAEEVVVRSRSKAVVEEGGAFLSNYICLKPVKSLQMYPTATLIGEGATARFNSILYAHLHSHIDVGSRVILSKPNTKAEIISRAVTNGGTIIARGHLKGEAPFVKAHLECRGLILSSGGAIHAIPELEGKNKDLDMSHEAAVGKIAKEEIEYLMARGLSSQEAQAVIVRGFMDTAILGLPPELQKGIDDLVKSCQEETM